MELTRHTFDEELENIITDIKESTFLAVDGEFTGLDTVNNGHLAPFDTPEERYGKIRNGSADFLLIQFGLCAFKADEEKQKYVAKPYNFYVFPKPYNRSAPDRRFLCQSSSIDFLISQGFDFNKLFKEGIPYLTPEQELKLKTDLERKHEEANKLSSPCAVDPNGTPGSAKKVLVPVPEEQKDFLKNICDQIAEYLEGDETEPLAFPPCNAFQRKLIYQTVEEKFPLVHLETKTGDKKERYMLVTKENAEERQKRQINKQAMEKMELDLQVGFTKVIKAISESGKLVVGHNMFLDVIHTVNQFHCQLPEDLDDFKSVVSSVFPRLLDTKLMASTGPFKEYITFSSLDEVRLTLQKPPFSTAKVETAEGFDRYDDGGGALHEAGYDAYVTGCCFATMTKFLGTIQDPPTEFLLPSSHVIEPFVNKLFLMRIADIPYLNLSGPDLEAKREHVFHVTFPKEWKPSDLHSLFQPYGNIQISWLTETTAYAALYKKENALIALQGLSQDDGSPYHVVSYAFHNRSKSLQWSSPSSLAATKKRKLIQADVEFPPSKVKRQSLTNESVPPTIPEEDENMSSSGAQNDNGNHSKDKETSTKRQSKLFEESEAW